MNSVINRMLIFAIAGLAAPILAAKPFATISCGQLIGGMTALSF